MNKHLNSYIVNKITSLNNNFVMLKSFFMGRVYPIDENMEAKTDNITSPRLQALRRGVNIRSILLIWLMLSSILLLIIWGAFAQIDVIVRGMGKVVPSQRVQYIQNLEGGIVDKVFVKEGDIVEQDALLARIDNVAAGSQYREALIRSLDLKATIARLEALIQDNEPDYPAEVISVPELIKRHNNILNAMRTQLNSELQVLDLQAESKHREALENEAKKTQLIASLKLAQRQRNIAANALRQKAFSALDFINLEQSVHGLKMDITSLEHSIPRLHIEAQEMKERKAQRTAEHIAENSQEIGEIQASLVSLSELLKAGSDKVNRTEIRSPVRGIIKSIHTNTVGGVIAPGATLIEVVPIDDTLIIEARFSPADIAFLYPGLKAIVRLTAYDFSRYGSMDALVENIGADTLENERGEVFYNVKVRTNRTSLHNQGKELPIMAGMQAEIDIVTGKKTILDYILKPLLKVRDRAFREQ